MLAGVPLQLRTCTHKCILNLQTYSYVATGYMMASHVHVAHHYITTSTEHVAT